MATRKRIYISVHNVVKCIDKCYAFFIYILLFSKINIERLDKIVFYTGYVLKLLRQSGTVFKFRVTSVSSRRGCM